MAQRDVAGVAHVHAYGDAGLAPLGLQRGGDEWQFGPVGEGAQREPQRLALRIPQPVRAAPPARRGQ